MKDPAITLSATQGSNLQDAYDYAEVAARGERQRRTGTAEGWNAIFYKGKQLEASSLREALVKARSYAEKAGMVVEASCARDRSNAACRASGERLMADVVAFAKAGGVDATTGVPFYRPCVACGRAQDTFHAECWACREKATEAALRMRSAVGAAILRLVAEHGAHGEGIRPPGPGLEGRRRSGRGHRGDHGLRAVDRGRLAQRGARPPR